MTMAIPMIETSMWTQKDLEKALQSLGIESGQTLVVHSSMKSIGWVVGGARAVIDALLTVLGPEGTLVMPAQTGDNSEPAYWCAPAVPRDWWPEIRASMPAFDPQLSPLRHMGAIPNCFRLYPGVLRSNHPLDSFIGCGPKAEWILSDHPLEGGLGQNSPAQKLYDAAAQVLLMGVDYDRCTVMHLAEFHARSRITLRQGSAIFEQDQRVWKTYRDIALNSDEFIHPGRLLDASDKVSQGLIGLAQSRLFSVQQAVDQTTDWLTIHRHHRLRPEEKETVLSMLKERPIENLFAIGDLEALSETDDYFDALVLYQQPKQVNNQKQVNDQDFEIESVVIRYNTSIVIASSTDDCAIEPILATIDHPSINFISGRASLVEKLKPHRSELNYRRMNLLQIDRQHFSAAEIANSSISGYSRPEIASAADVPDLIELLQQIEEFNSTSNRDDLKDEMTQAMNRGLSRYVFQRYQGRIVAMAGTSAENSMSAMVVAVATHPDHRGKGLASRLVAALCDNNLGHRFAAMALFYDNPEAGKIYRRLGFYDAGDWMMASAPDPTH